MRVPARRDRADMLRSRWENRPPFQGVKLRREGHGPGTAAPGVIRPCLAYPPARVIPTTPTPMFRGVEIHLGPIGRVKP